MGGKGEGPGEFERARSLAIYNNKILIVSNGYRIETFDISGKEITFHKTFQFKKPFRSICTVGDQLFTHHDIIFDDNNSKDFKTINNIQTFLLPSFKPLHSFGRAYKSNNISTIERLSNGEISCNEETQTITFIFKRMPIILGYNSTDGKLKWGTRIDNLRLPKIIQSKINGRSSLTYRVPEGGIRDNIFRSVDTNNHFVLIQILRRKMSENSLDYDTKIISLMVNAHNGKAYVSSKKLPLIMSISNETNVFTVSKDFTNT